MVEQRRDTAAILSHVSTMYVRLVHRWLAVDYRLLCGWTPLPTPGDQRVALIAARPSEKHG